jgi:hypothetical protein
VFSASDKNPWHVGRFSHAPRSLVGCSPAMLAPQRCALVIAPTRKDRVDNGLERPGSRGDCILHSRWYLGEYLAAKPVGFEFAKLCCQRVLGDARDRAPSAHGSAKRPRRKPNRQQLQHNLPLAEVARLIQSTSLIQRTILGQYSSSVRLPMNRPR